MRVKDCMCNKLVSVTPETTIHDVAKLMQENKIGSVVVCDTKGECQGFITDRDIVVRGVSCGKNCDCTKVSDIMTKEVIKTTSDTEVHCACDVMAKNQVKRLPVIEDGKVVGVLSLGDVANTSSVSTEDFGNTATELMSKNGIYEKHND